MLPANLFTSKTDQILAIARRLVEIESPSHDKAALDSLGDLLSHELSRLGARVTLEPQVESGNHVVARWIKPGAAHRFLLLFHMDTVHPVGSLLRNPFRIEDHKVYGPGVLDMKGSIAILLSVLETLKDQNIWPDHEITALITSDEETGSHSSRELIESLARESSLVLCMEPSLSKGELKTWRKGVGGFTVRVHGRAAHAGAEPEQGRSAIEEMAHQILAIQKMANWEKGTTLNVGLVQGGTATNVIPEDAQAQVDLRFLEAEEGERVIRQMHSLEPRLDGTVIQVEGGVNRPPMPRDARMVKTFGKASEIAAQAGIDLQEGGTGGGSDANFVAPLGVAVLDGLGLRGGGAHSEREFAWIESLEIRARLLAALLTGW